MGLFDSIFSFFGQQGSTVTQRVTGSQPVTSTGTTYTANQTTYVSQPVSTPAAQPVQVNWVQGAIGYVGGAIGGGIEAANRMISPVVAPVAAPVQNTFNAVVRDPVSLVAPAAMLFVNPIAIPAMVGTTIVVGEIGRAHV